MRFARTGVNSNQCKIVQMHVEVKQVDKKSRNCILDICDAVLLGSSFFYFLVPAGDPAGRLSNHNFRCMPLSTNQKMIWWCVPQLHVTDTYIFRL